MVPGEDPSDDESDCETGPGARVTVGAGVRVGVGVDVVNPNTLKLVIP